jgi:hypothetical protein
MTLRTVAVIYIIGAIVASIIAGIVNERTPWLSEQGPGNSSKAPPDLVVALGWPLWIMLYLISSPFWLPGIIADKVRDLKARYQRKKAVEKLLNSSQKDR